MGVGVIKNANEIGFRYRGNGDGNGARRRKKKMWQIPRGIQIGVWISGRTKGLGDTEQIRI